MDIKQIEQKDGRIRFHQYKIPVVLSSNTILFAAECKPAIAIIIAITKWVMSNRTVSNTGYNTINTVAAGNSTHTRNTLYYIVYIYLLTTL